MPPCNPCQPISSPCVPSGSCNCLPPNPLQIPRPGFATFNPSSPKPIETSISRLQPHYPCNPPQSFASSSTSTHCTIHPILCLSPLFFTAPPPRPQHNPCLIPKASYGFKIAMGATSLPPPHRTAGEPCVSLIPPNTLLGGSAPPQSSPPRTAGAACCSAVITGPILAAPHHHVRLIPRRGPGGPGPVQLGRCQDRQTARELPG